MPQNRPQDYTAERSEDTQTRIQEILAGISSPNGSEPQQGFWMRLLQAVPQALSVGVSQDPGAALGQQIATQFQQVQIEKQRRQRLKELGATLEIEDLLERTREGRREAAETRRFERETTQREKEFKAASKEQRSQLILNNRFQKSRDQFQANETRLRDMRQNQASKDLTQLQANATRENQFFAEVAKNSMEAIMSGEMDAGTAVDLYSRLANKELPTKEDITKMNKAIKSQQDKIQRMALQRIGAEAQARLTASGKSPMQAAQEFAFEFSQKTPMIWITDVDGQQKLVKRDVDPLTQQPALISGQKFVREATPLEVQQYALQTFSQMQGFTQQSGMNIPNSQNKLGHAEGLVREAAKTKPFEQVKTDFLKPEIYQKLQLTKGEADTIIQTIEAETKGQPPPLPSTLDDSEAELKEIEEEIRLLTPSTPGRAVAVPRNLSQEDRGRLRSLREREVSIKERKQKQATVKFIQDRLDAAKAQLQGARTQARRERLESEITDLESRLRVAQDSANK
jgi:hypothetical protein